MTNSSPILIVWLMGALTVSSGWAGAAEDWPAYGHDAARRGVTSAEIEVPLYPQWVYSPRHAPQPAWPEPRKELHRIDFDYAFQVAVAKGVVYFGSSADNKVYALDAESGTERWSFFTGGPVRLAPAVWKDRVFVASDDGWLYCLSAAGGKLIWKFRGGPRDDKLIGNGRMISRWPLRGGVLVDDGTVYLAAGMWPSEGVFVYALRADGGSVIWKNDSSDNMHMRLPHGMEDAVTGIAPQGYLLASKDVLIVPTGRGAPAALDRETGRLLFYKLEGGVGAWASVTGNLIFAGLNLRPASNSGALRAWDYRTRDEIFDLLGKKRAVAGAKTLYAAGSNLLSAYDFKTVAAGKLWPAQEPLPLDQFMQQFNRIRSGTLARERAKQSLKWEKPCGPTYSLIMAGNTIFVGGLDRVTAFDVAEGKLLWSGNVRGEARGLAVADGKLLVSTNRGEIACFGTADKGKPTSVHAAVDATPYSTDEFTPAHTAIAKRIINETAITEGYCLVLGAGDGRLAHELAKRTKLDIYCIERDSQKVTAARKALDAAGLYGVRVTVDRGSLRTLPYAAYFADLIVSGNDPAQYPAEASAKELYRVLRPCGGIAWFDVATSGTGPSAENIRTWLREGGVPDSEIRSSAQAVTIVRGPLPGAGGWTHQFANAGKSGCAADEIVKAPLGVLWFGGPGPARMMARHWAATAPVSANGRMFLTGLDSVIAVDAYNGRELWMHTLTSVGRNRTIARKRWNSPTPSLTSDTVAEDDSIYVCLRNVCLRLDAKTGKQIRSYNLPPSAEPDESSWWGYLARWGDLVLGSVEIDNKTRTRESRHVFALEKESGRLRWVHHARGIVPNGAIAVDAGRVVLLERAGDTDRRRGKLGTLPLMALDVDTGKQLWTTGQKLDTHDTLRVASGVVLATGGSLANLQRAGTYQISAYSLGDGGFLWNQKIPAERLPAIVGETIYAHPFAYDLRTGKQKTRSHALTGDEVAWRFQKGHGCGMISACPSLLMFRSSSAGFYDLLNDSGVENFGGLRPGCAVNMIAANGLVLIPEASSECTCGYSFQTCVALAPAAKAENWSVYSDANRPGPLRHVSVNLGAPGDRRDEEGALWLGFPRPTPGILRLELDVPLTADILPGMGYYRHSSEGRVIEGTNRPWLYASGCRGLKSVSVKVDLPKSLPVLPCNQPPKIDGKLNDSCWDGKAPLTLVDENRPPRAPKVFLRSDTNKLYAAFRQSRSSLVGGRYLVALAKKAEGRDADISKDDSWELFFSDDKRTLCVEIGISASGARSDGRLTYARNGRRDRDWNGAWTSAVSEDKDGWTLELAVPWQTLGDAGLDRERLALNIKANCSTLFGRSDTVYLQSPGPHGWASCERFIPVSPGNPPRAVADKRFTVRLHFAEPDDLKPGQRVFDVRIQGATVLKDFDIIKNAGGTDKAIVKEFKDVLASDAVKVELLPKVPAGQITASTAPVLGGVEVLIQQE